MGEKIGLQDCIAKNNRTNNDSVFIYMKSKKVPGMQLDNKRIKKKLKEDMKIAEKQNELFASVFTTENARQISGPELPFSGRKSKESSPAEVTREVSRFSLETTDLADTVDLILRKNRKQRLRINIFFFQRNNGVALRGRHVEVSYVTSLQGQNDCNKL